MRTLAIIIAAAAVSLTVPTVANATDWKSCKTTGNLGFTDGATGGVGVFSHLKANPRMSCSSARHILNRQIRAMYAATGNVPTRFSQGQRTWYCAEFGERSTGSHATVVGCDEQSRRTAIRFDFHEYFD